MSMDDMPMPMGEDDPDAFCKGMAMSMYMEGFTSAFRTSWWSFAPTTAMRHKTPGCLNLFFPEWTLDSGHRFVGAMVGVFCLGVGVEALSALRRRRAISVARAGRAQGPLATLETSALYSLQLALGYFLMLAIMTYSCELFAAAVVGVGVGHGAFRTRREAKGALVTAAETCCAGLDAERAQLPDASGYCALGQSAPRRTAVLKVGGMTCQTCVAAVQSALLRLPTVEAAAVDLASNTATVTGVATLDQLLAAVDESGFGAGSA